jgi:hypothetical protein
MKLIRDAGLLYIILFFGGGGTLIFPYLLAVIVLYLTGVIG